MEGVRRWIGANPTSSPQKHGKPTSRVEVKKTHPEPELEPNSTEAVAKQLLDPSVTEEEEAEYQGYIDQCQELLDAPKTIAERKDFEVYQLAVRTGSGEVPDGRDETIDDALIAYVERGMTQYLDGPRKDGVPTTAFNYDRWVTQRT